MNVHLLTCAIAIGACACVPKRVNPVTPEPLLRPAGWSCIVADVAVRDAPSRVYARGLAAIKRMHLTPSLDDAEARHLVVSGDNAPAGRGSIHMQEARLYLDFSVVPDSADAGAALFTIAPGLSNEPKGATPQELLSVYRQAEQFGHAFLDSAGLSHSLCGNKS